MWMGEMLLAVVLLFGLILLARSWRASEARAVEQEEENETLVAERDRLRAELARETKVRTRQAEELATYRRRSDKASRRKSKAVDQPLGTAARIRDHEARAAQLELERGRVTTERDDLVQQVSRLEAELAERLREIERLSVPTPIEAEQASALARKESELSRSREGLSKLEEELAAVRQTEARLRKRMENQEQLYASLRAELEIKKDRLRTQEEQLLRFQSLEAAIRD